MTVTFLRLFGTMELEYGASMVKNIVIMTNQQLYGQVVDKNGDSMENDIVLEGPLLYGQTVIKNIGKKGFARYRFCHLI